MSTTALKEDVTNNSAVLGVGSSVTIFSNKDFMTSVGCTSRPLKLETSGSETKAKKMGTIHNLSAQIRIRSIESMTSLPHATSRDKKVMRSKYCPDAKVEIELGAWERFTPSDISFHARNIRSNTEVSSDNNSKYELNDCLFLQTVIENLRKCTSIKVKATNESKVLAKRVGNAPIDKLRKWSSQKCAHSTPLASKGARRGELTNGKEIARLRRSSARRKTMISRPIVMGVPRSLVEINRIARSFISIMRVSRSHLLHSTLEGMRLRA